MFIEWISNEYDGVTPIFLGGSHEEGDDLCFSITGDRKKAGPLLECSHEEADDRILFHVDHIVKLDGFKDVAVASPDTDVFVSLTHHFDKFRYFDLKEMWLIAGRSQSRTVTPIHAIVNAMDQDFIELLPVIHALTECDTTSKVGTKKMAIKQGIKKWL